MVYYGFEYLDKKNTTSGLPNNKTGCYNIAGHLRKFVTKDELNEWVNRINTTNRIREAVSLKKARALHLGMPVSDYKELLEELIPY